MLSKFIQQLRQKNNLTQEYLASKLNMSRPTYAQIEQGERELNISEANKLSEVFNVSRENLLNEIDSSIMIDVQNDKALSTKEKMGIRINVPQKNIKKFKEIFLYVLSKIGSKLNVGESVLNKLFYFIDFDYYEKYEEQIIGATYIKNHYGPTPCEFKKIIEEMKKSNEIEEVKSKYFQFDQKKFLPLRKPNLDILTARETEHIDDVLSRLSDKSANEIKEYSHGDMPFLVHRDGEKINYESVFYRDEKYSVRTYDDEL
ncbi:MAG: type II toxin-antitoxin system antitoxin SocA domain-containing protein [Patescibacteria group bacterium]